MNVLSRGQTLVVYHHLGRKSHAEEVAERVRQCTERFSRLTLGLRFRRGTSRAFLVVAAKRDED